jgi:Nitroreductase
MEFTQVLQSRQTIREFTSESIAPDVVTRLIASGFAAPSNNHLRQWHFINLEDRALRQQILTQVIHPLDRKGSQAVINRWGMTDSTQREMYLDAIPLQYSMLLNAGALLLPFFAQPAPLLKPKSLSDLNAFASIWCCVENILLAAANEGIFGVTRIPFKEESQFVKETLHVPEGYEFPCWIALGYPAADAKRAKQLSIDLTDRIHANLWPS